MSGIMEARAELRERLGGSRPQHVTELAAACLRATDAQALNEALADYLARREYQERRREAMDVLAGAGGALNLVYPATLRELGAAMADADVSGARASLISRAIAEALHETRHQEFWSYFADWPGPRLLAEGDPFPVPTAVTLSDIYPSPLRVSSSPDEMDTPHGLCRGGYRGLPSLRLVPPHDAVDVYLDPSLPFDFCPLTSGPASGHVSILVPAEHLDAGYDYETHDLRDGERVFDRVRPKDGAGLVNRVLADARLAATESALAVMPELTSSPEVEARFDAAMRAGELGHVQLLVGGSAWIEPSASDAAGANRASIWPRGREVHHHFKFSWFHHRVVGSEHIARGRKRITIMAGPRISYAVLICKDALETWVPHVLEELRVRLVVIPSCNPGVGTYRTVAHGLAQRGWSTVVLANIPPDESCPREYVLVVRPACVGQRGVPSTITELAPAGRFVSRVPLSIRWR